MLNRRDEQRRFEVAQAHPGGFAEKILSGGVAQDALIEGGRYSGAEEPGGAGGGVGEVVHPRTTVFCPGEFVEGDLEPARVAAEPSA